jgi:hypothetical protein
MNIRAVLGLPRFSCRRIFERKVHEDQAASSNHWTQAIHFAIHEGITDNAAPPGGMLYSLQGRK